MSMTQMVMAFRELANPNGQFPSVGTGKLFKKIFPGGEWKWYTFPWPLTHRFFSLRKLILPASIRGEFLRVPPPIPMKFLIGWPGQPRDSGKMLQPSGKLIARIFANHFIIWYGRGLPKKRTSPSTESGQTLYADCGRRPAFINWAFENARKWYSGF